MHRRTALGYLALASLPVTLAQAQAPARPADLGPMETTHLNQTMEAGSMSLEASRVAISKATAAGVKRFAQVESAEQQTIASVLKMRAGLAENAKPPMSAEAKAGIDKLHDVKTGLEFDKAYVAAQIEGHQKLLQIQETYLTDGKDPTHTAIAMLARGHIKEHLGNLEIIQKELVG